VAVKTKRRRRPRDEDDEEPRSKKRSRARNDDDEDDEKSSKVSAKGGLTVKTYGGGLNKDRIQKSSSGGKRLFLIKGKSVPVMFPSPPSDTDAFKEYDQHVWQEGRKWNFAPCIATEDDPEACPYCSDDDPAIAKTSYGFCCQVWDVKNKCWRVMTGPGKLSMLIVNRWEKRKKTFTKVVFDVTQLDTKPVGYDIDATEEDPPKTKGEPYDLDEFLAEEFERVTGNAGSGTDKKASKSSLEDDDDDEDSDDDDEAHTEEELEEMSSRELKRLARSLGIDTEDMSRKKLIRAIQQEEE
jgi:hypothetical protein